MKGFISSLLVVVLFSLVAGTGTDTAAFISKYAHDTSLLGSTVGFNIGYFSISISSGSSYDTAAAQSSWLF